MSRRGPARARRGAALLLALLVGVLAYVNWQVARTELDISPAAADAGAPVAAFPPLALEPPAEPPALSDFDEIVRRPLFTVARRPPEAPAESAPEAAAEPAAAEAEAPLPELQLVGIAIDGGNRQALLRTTGAGEEWVSEGDSVAGWRLERVAADGVVLGSGEARQELSLYPVRESGSGGQ